MSRFEDELWEVLVREHGAASIRAHRTRGVSGTRRRTVPMVLSAVILAAATAAAIALLAAGHNPSAAYALSQSADGTVTLTLDELLGVQPADEELAKLGVPVVVAKVEAGCTEAGQAQIEPGDGRIMKIVETVRNGEGLDGITWVIRPAAIPAGDTLGLTVQRDPYSPIPAIGTGMALYRGQAPRCSKGATFSG